MSGPTSEGDALASAAINTLRAGAVTRFLYTLFGKYETATWAGKTYFIREIK